MSFGCQTERGQAKKEGIVHKEEASKDEAAEQPQGAWTGRERSQAGAGGLWALMSSSGLGVFLGVCLSLLIMLAAGLQLRGPLLELAKAPENAAIREAMRFGLNDPLSSPWVWALFWLWVANAGLITLRAIMESREPPPETAPDEADQLVFEAKAPEVAAERVMEGFRADLGAPLWQQREGAQLRLLYDVAPAKAYAGPVWQFGLIFALFGLMLAVRPAAEADLLARAVFDVHDRQSGVHTRFDMVQGEPFQFFQVPSRYSLLRYRPDQAGQGPAVLIDRAGSQEAPSGDRFWVYREASMGFDRRHRQGALGFNPIRMGVQARPGSRPAFAWGQAMLLVGLAMAFLGWFLNRRPRVWMWLQLTGSQLRMQLAGPSLETKGYLRMRLRLKQQAEHYLEEDL